MQEEGREEEPFPFAFRQVIVAVIVDCVASKSECVLFSVFDYLHIYCRFVPRIVSAYYMLAACVCFLVLCTLNCSVTDISAVDTKSRTVEDT